MLFLEDACRLPIEQVVSKYRGQKWVVKAFKDLNDLSSHPSALLSDGSYSVFVKQSTAANGSEQFEIELAGLRFLSERSGVRIPTAIGNAPVEGGVVMVLEGITALERTPREWRVSVGAWRKSTPSRVISLAWIHIIILVPCIRITDPCRIGQRSWWNAGSSPCFMGAINAGHMPMDVIYQVEKLIPRIPQFFESEIVPTLLHGDAQQNNFISTESGAVVGDPAIYYGHPEMDLAYVDYFQPVPDDVFVGYRELLPIDPLFNERRDLWRLYGYLAAVEVEGALHLPKLIQAVQKYL